MQHSYKSKIIEALVTCQLTTYADASKLIEFPENQSSWLACWWINGIMDEAQVAHYNGVHGIVQTDCCKEVLVYCHL